MPYGITLKAPSHLTST